MATLCFPHSRLPANSLEMFMLGGNGGIIGVGF